MTLVSGGPLDLAEFNQTVKAFRDALDSYRFDIGQAFCTILPGPVL
ncbi:hypothetical protein ACNKHS_25055 [Shigella flexneri]